MQWLARGRSPGLGQKFEHSLHRSCSTGSGGTSCGAHEFVWFRRDAPTCSQCCKAAFVKLGEAHRDITPIPAALVYAPPFSATCPCSASSEACSRLARRAPSSSSLDLLGKQGPVAAARIAPESTCRGSQRQQVFQLGVLAAYFLGCCSM